MLPNVPLSVSILPQKPSHAPVLPAIEGSGRKEIIKRGRLSSARAYNSRAKKQDATRSRTAAQPRMTCLSSDARCRFIQIDG